MLITPFYFGPGASLPADALAAVVFLEPGAAAQ